MTQFAARPDYQLHISEQSGIHAFTQCMKDSWRKDAQVQLFSLSAIYTCLRQNTDLCIAHADRVVEAVVETLKFYLTDAKINLFGCWILYEIAQVPQTVLLLRNAEMVKLVQAVQTRFHDDEIIQLATKNVLDLITKDVQDVTEALRLGVARGACS